MGQYYRPILLAEDKKTPLFNIHTWVFQCGMKLTEHSYIGNPVLGAIEKMICDKPTCLVWGGDYADVEVDNTDNLYEISDNVGERKLRLKSWKINFVTFQRISANILSTTLKSSLLINQNALTIYGKRINTHYTHWHSLPQRVMAEVAEIMRVLIWNS